MGASSLSVTQGLGTGLAARGIGSGGTTYAQSVDIAPWPAVADAGAQTITVGTTSAGTTTAGAFGTITIPANATHAYISVEGANGIRFWNSGDFPTAGAAGSGHWLATGAGPLEIDNLALLRFVSASTASGTVQISYHHYA